MSLSYSSLKPFLMLIFTCAIIPYQTMGSCPNPYPTVPPGHTFIPHNPTSLPQPNIQFHLPRGTVYSVPCPIFLQIGFIPRWVKWKKRLLGGHWWHRLPLSPQPPTPSTPKSTLLPKLRGDTQESVDFLIKNLY